MIRPALRDEETFVSSATALSISRRLCAPPSFVHRSIAASSVGQLDTRRSRAAGGVTTVAIVASTHEGGSLGTNMIGRDVFRNKYSEVFGERSRACGH